MKKLLLALLVMGMTAPVFEVSAAVADPMEPVVAAAKDADSKRFAEEVMKLPDTQPEYAQLKAKLKLALRLRKAATAKPRDTAEGFQVMADYCKLRKSEDAPVYQRLADAWRGDDTVELYRAVDAYWGRPANERVSPAESNAAMRSEGTSHARSFRRRVETYFWKSHSLRVLKLDYLMKSVTRKGGR